MPTEISGATGVNKVQSSAIETGDLPTGSVLQVVQGSATTQTSSSSASYIEYTALSTSITPSLSTSKILILVQNSCRVWSSQSATYSYFMLARDNVQVSDDIQFSTHDYGGSGVQARIPMPIMYLDSPNTTSSVEYSVWGKLDSGTNFGWGVSGSQSTITLMEIAG